MNQITHRIEVNKSNDQTYIKSKAVELIASIIKSRNWTQMEAAKVLEIDQPKISQMTHGYTAGFSVHRLLKLLVKLGCEVEITIKKNKNSNA